MPGSQFPKATLKTGQELAGKHPNFLTLSGTSLGALCTASHKVPVRSEPSIRGRNLLTTYPSLAFPTYACLASPPFPVLPDITAQINYSLKPLFQRVLLGDPDYKSFGILMLPHQASNP